MHVATQIASPNETLHAPLPALTGHRRALMDACLASVTRFAVPGSGILAGVASWNGTTWTRSEPSPDQTANMLVALYELRRRGVATPVDPDVMMDRLMLEYFHSLDYTSIAFLLWADSLAEPRYEAILWNALRARMPAHVSQTMQLGWTLSALSHYVAIASDAPAVTRLARELYGRIAANQANSGLFFASGTREGWLRRRLADSSLASQAYPIHGLALYGRVFDVPEALTRAERCADALCRLQGPLGQWWSRYNVETGSVSEKYPMFAINQDTAMPMCLGELQHSLGTRRYAAAADKGVRWLFGANEVGRSLLDESVGVVWRAIRPREGAFEIVREIHAYHTARCLYSLCSEERRP